MSEQVVEITSESIDTNTNAIRALTAHKMIAGFDQRFRIPLTPLRRVVLIWASIPSWLLLSSYIPDEQDAVVGIAVVAAVLTMLAIMYSVNVHLNVPFKTLSQARRYAERDLSVFAIKLSQLTERYNQLVEIWDLALEGEKLGVSVVSDELRGFGDKLVQIRKKICHWVKIFDYYSRLEEAKVPDLSHGSIDLQISELAELEQDLIEITQLRQADAVSSIAQLEELSVAEGEVADLTGQVGELRRTVNKEARQATLQPTRHSEHT